MQLLELKVSCANLAYEKKKKQVIIFLAWVEL